LKVLLQLLLLCAQELYRFLPFWDVFSIFFLKFTLRLLELLLQGFVSVILLQADLGKTFILLVLNSLLSSHISDKILRQALNLPVKVYVNFQILWLLFAITQLLRCFCENRH